MAGDWIKMRTALADDPAVIAMADALDTDEFSVVGRLHHLWSWADAQSRDGHAPGVTSKWINRYVRCDQFAEAMINVKWLIADASGITFPNFDRHNGETAKARALATNRKQKQRASVTDMSNDVSRNERDESVTREEKRREDKNIGSNGGGELLTETPVDNFSPLAAAEILKNLTAWEATRGKAVKAIPPTDDSLVDLADRKITSKDLRSAYDLAVAARLKAADAMPVNPGFIGRFVDELRAAPVLSPRIDEWDRTASGIERKAREIGLKIIPFEPTPTLAMRVKAELEKLEHAA